MPNNDDFAFIRSSGQVYVDKTLFIYKLAVDSQPYFLSRPRRFGKSTLISTFEELFKHGVKPYDGHDSYFKGLAIEKLWHDEGEYKVIRLDFLDIFGTSESAADFEQNFVQELRSVALSFNVLIPTDVNALSGAFTYLIKSFPLKRAVLLIDEYDAPITAGLDWDKTEADKVTALLRSFFHAVKRLGRNFRFVFITGITRYKDAYLLTQGNTVLDISQQAVFGECCGYTRDEIKHYFADHLICKTAKFFNCAPAAVTEAMKDQLMDELAFWYDGYCFDEEGLTQVFSTWSVLQFFKDRQVRGAPFKNFWYAGGGQSKLIKNALERSDIIALLQGIESEQTIALNDFTSPASFDSMLPQVLLYQCGYLTLKEGYMLPDGAEPFVKMRLPNFEIKQSAAREAMSRRFKPEAAGDLSLRGIKQLVTEHDIVRLQELLARVFASIDYEHTPVINEAGVSLVLQIFFLFCGCDIVCNAHQSGGRADAVISCGDTTLVLEYKYSRTGTDEDIARLLSAAKDQILSWDYGNTLRRRRYLWRAALVFAAPHTVRMENADLTES